MICKTPIILCLTSTLLLHAQYTLKEESYPLNIKTLKNTYYYNDSLYQESTIHFNEKGQKSYTEYYLVGLNNYGTWIKSTTGWVKYYYNKFDSLRCVVDYNRPIMYSMIVTEKDSSLYVYDKKHVLSKIVTHSIRPAMNRTTVSEEYYFHPNDSISIWGRDWQTSGYDTTFKRIYTSNDTIIHQHITHSYRDRMEAFYWVDSRLMKQMKYEEDLTTKSFTIKEMILFTYFPDSSYIKLTVFPVEAGRKYAFYQEEKYDKQGRTEYINLYSDHEIREDRKNFTEFQYEFNDDGTLSATIVTQRNSTGYYSYKKNRYYYTYY